MKQTSSSQERNYRMVRVGLIIMLVLLVIQFCVGMYLNLYAELPDTHPGTSGSYAPSIPWALAGHAGAALAVHVTVWILLTLGAFAMLVRGIMSKRKAMIIGSSLGLLFILTSGSGGLSFLNRGGTNMDSLMMALGFIAAFVTYGVTFYKTKAN